MLLNVEITKDDITKGVRGDCAECPNSLAVERAVRSMLNTTDRILMSTTVESTAILVGDDDYYFFTNPQMLRLFVLTYDAGVSPQTFKYEAELESESRV